MFCLFLFDWERGDVAYPHRQSITAFGRDASFSIDDLFIHWKEEEEEEEEEGKENKYYPKPTIFSPTTNERNGILRV